MSGGFDFSEKHREYMRRAYVSVMNVAEGAVRAGKTIDNVFVFAALLEKSPDRIHLATGSTLGNAKLNLGDCNGMGLEKMFAGRFDWVRYRGNDAMLVRTAVGERIIIFAGGRNSDSYKKIRGCSFGMWLATEINLHSPSFIEEALNRQLAARDRRIFWDLNPDRPSAMIYVDYIDKYRRMSEAGELGANFFNYGHFTIFDNPTISPERLSEIEAQYERGSVWYRRDILGERCAAEGLIYRRYADSPEEFTLLGLSSSEIDFINVGIDFGGNRSRTAFVAMGFKKERGEYIFTALGERVILGEKGEIDPERIERECAGFLSSLHAQYGGVSVRYIFADSEAQYLINGLRRHLSRLGEGASVCDCAKRPILDRISFVNRLFACGRIRILACCRELSEGLSSAAWGEDGRRLDNFTSDIDILDAMEYAIERYM